MTMSLETNSELDQANLRIVVATIAIVYISLLGFLPGQSLDTYLPVILYIFVFLLASIVLRQVIARWPGHYPARRIFGMIHDYTGCLLYTSDAADDMQCVDLGGRRIIKKKKRA